MRWGKIYPDEEFLVGVGGATEWGSDSRVDSRGEFLGTVLGTAGTLSEFVSLERNCCCFARRPVDVGNNKGC